MIALSASAFGYLISSMFEKPEDAVGMTPTILLPIVLFGGLFTNVGSVGKWISWI